MDCVAVAADWPWWFCHVGLETTCKCAGSPSVGQGRVAIDCAWERREMKGAGYLVCVGWGWMDFEDPEGGFVWEAPVDGVTRGSVVAPFRT